MTAAIPKIAFATTKAALHTAVRQWRKDGAQVALVPTMGALHAGHLALVEAARARTDKVVVSIFVNPTQFAPHEDFTRYPRDPAGDHAMLDTQGKTDLVYEPDSTEMYPDSFATKIVVDGPARGLESDFRPHFFAGVATVVSKLLIQCAPDLACFGEKDYQQLLVMKRLVEDLDLNVEIAGIPTLRESDGLALSSRNRYLTKDQRLVAGRLNRILNTVAGRAKDGISIPQAEAEGAAELIKAGFDRIDYVAIRNAQTLQAVNDVVRPARVLAAARIGTVRLIDNLAI